MYIHKTENSPYFLWRYFHPRRRPQQNFTMMSPSDKQNDPHYFPYFEYIAQYLYGKYGSQVDVENYL